MTALNPDLTAVVVLFLILCFFFFRAVLARLVGQTIGQTDEEFSLASRQIKKNEIALSMGASYSAFATVFFWFLALGGGYSYLLFLIPICLFYGNKLFVK